MNQQELIFAEVPVEKFSLLTKEELIIYLKGEQDLRLQLQDEVKNLRALNEELNQRSYTVQELLITVKNKMFGKSSERSAKPEANSGTGDKEKNKKEKKKKVQLPSQRYPDAPLIERDVTLDHLPDCSCCGAEMEDSGMTEDSEYLTVIPEQHIVIRQKRHKYRCGKCHGDIKTAPAPPRITPGGSYSDEMMIDVSVSKFCDLIPVERYAAMAGREGLENLPPQSLIESTHQVADFVEPAYDQLVTEIKASTVLNADETPHRMLEGSDKSHWYLWGFSTPRTSYFEIHDTRSGDVASSLLKDSLCEYLVSDVFSGYGKAVGETNKFRQVQKLPLIQNVYCNAHVRRKFAEADKIFEQLLKDSASPEARFAFEAARKEVRFFLSQYRKIYRLESLAKKHLAQASRIRERMTKYFEKMRAKALGDIAGYSSKSSFGKAMNYLLKNYEAFTLFLTDSRLPIDNNSQERLLRSPVVGRKTWYGTHSERGARTTAILFSLVESCKLNKINPRRFLKDLVTALHQGKPAFTPAAYKDSLTEAQAPPSS